MLKIYCKNTGTSLEFQEGTTLAEMLPRFEFERPYDVLCAKVNNVTQGLKYRAFNNRDVEYLDYRSYAGRSAYCRSLCFASREEKKSSTFFPKSGRQRAAGLGPSIRSTRRYLIRKRPQAPSVMSRKYAASRGFRNSMT